MSSRKVTAMPMSYDNWRSAIDALLFRRFGLDSDGLPDYDFQTAYTEGQSVESTVNAVLHRACEF